MRPPAGNRGGGHVSLLNIITELKKCCNHPFLFESAEEDYRGSEDDKSAVSPTIAAVRADALRSDHALRMPTHQHLREATTMAAVQRKCSERSFSE